MVTISIEIEPELYEVIENLAKIRSQTVSEVLRSLSVDDFARIRSRLKHPIIGVVDSGPTDISVRDEELRFSRKDE